MARRAPFECQAGPAHRPPHVVAAACLVALLAACDGRQEPDSLEIGFTGTALGTTYTVKVVADRSAIGAARQESLEAAIRGALDDVDRSMSTYRPDSELSRFNAAPPDAPFSLSAETVTVIARALEISRESEGAFDVTVFPLVDAWGFGPSQPPLPPGAARLAELRSVVGYGLLELDAEHLTLSKRAAGVACDLSAIAKGYAVDRVAEALEALGTERYLVEVGGEIRARGRNSSDRPWQLGIERPTSQRREVQRLIPMTSGALATSGDYRNFYMLEGRRYSHTIDPRTGAPVTHNLAAASVLADDAMSADAYATTLMVLGPEAGLQFAERRNLAVLLLVYNDEGGVDERTSPALETYLADQRSLDGASDRQEKSSTWPSS